MIIVMAVLFAILTPGVALYLPPRSSLLVAAVTHGLVFSIVWHFISKPLGAFVQGL
jgi:hypothetical protein